jgi:glucokinase
MNTMSGKQVVAVDLGGTKLAAALVDSRGRMSKQTILAVDTSSSTAPLRQIVQVTRELIGTNKTKNKISAVGVAVPGLVRRDGTVWAPNLKGWKRMALAQRLKRALQLPVFVESDRNAAVLGETWLGAAKRKSDAIVLMLGPESALEFGAAADSCEALMNFPAAPDGWWWPMHTEGKRARSANWNR